MIWPHIDVKDLSQNQRKIFPIFLNNLYEHAPDIIWLHEHEILLAYLSARDLLECSQFSGGINSKMDKLKSTSKWKEKFNAEKISEPIKCAIRDVAIRVDR